MSDGFVNLHVHSEYSLLDGMIKVDDLVKKTLEFNQIASVITDHGNAYIIPDHFKEVKKQGQHAIAGVELYTVKDHTIMGKSEGEDESEAKRNHFLLLAKNKSGYQKLCRILSKGYTEGFYYRPRVDNGIMEEYLEADGKESDVIGSSACLAGCISQSILKGDIESAEKFAKYYYKLFGGNFYLEIQPTQTYEQYIVNKELIDMSKRLSIPMIATTDAHYLNKEDKKTHDVLLCLQSHALISDPNRWSFPGNTYYIMKKDEILSYFQKEYDYKLIKKQNKKKHATSEFKYEYVHDYDGIKFTNPEKTIDGFISVEKEGHFSYADLDQNIIQEAIAETENVANQCTYDMEFGKHYLPKIHIPVEDVNFSKWRSKLKHQGKPNEDYLKYLCILGLKERGLMDKVYRKRLNYELGIINDMDFPDYFLIYYDIAKFCHDNNIPFGPGRGCFIPNELVKTNNTIKNIQDIQIGDKVYCHDELLHDVMAKHEYDIDEDLVSLSCNNEKIDGVTKDHKIYAIKKDDFDKGIREPKWYSAKDLSIGDYVCEL